jgi:hypothetical protein
MKRHFEDMSLIEVLTECGLVKFNTGITVSSMPDAMRFMAAAMEQLAQDEVHFFFQEESFDLLLSDVRGNEFIRCVRTGDSSIYSGKTSTFMVWAKPDLFAALRVKHFPTKK